MSDKKQLIKENWTASFTIVGKPVINDFTFKIDQHSERSDWVYNSMSLAIDCGEKYGRVYTDLMGGYASERENKIYAHGKKDNGTDDYSLRMEVAWEDRDNPEILEQVGDRCFTVVGIERTVKGQVYRKKFLSAYDAIAYIKEYLTEDMTVLVRGNLVYSIYNDKTQIKKTITSLVVIDEDDPSKYHANFVQTMLIDKDSASLHNIDKDKSVMFVNGWTLDYMKEYNGVEVRGNFPFPVQFEYAMDFTKPEQCKKIVEKVFKVKHGITQITFEGDFVESGATVKPTLDDVPDDIKDLIGIIWTEEEALEKCSVNGNRERRMVLRKPQIKMVGDDGNKSAQLQKFDERYDEDDLVLDCMVKKDESVEEDMEDWLDKLPF